MTQRERYLKLFVEQQDPTDLPLWGDWLNAHPNWVDQGMPPVPEGANPRNFLQDMMGFEGIYSAYWGTGRVPVNIGPFPGFPIRQLGSDDTHFTYTDPTGVTIREQKEKEGLYTPQQYLDHFLKGPEQWEEFKAACLDPHAPGRYPDDAAWQQIVKACHSDRDSVITIDGGSFYGHLRNWMGVEGLSYAMYDEPEWVEQAAEDLADFYIATLTRAVTDIPDIDVCLFWEDMCFKNGPLCSPDMFRRFFVKPYRRVTDFLKTHGVKTFWVDCDGNIDQLIDLFIQGGVNGFYPLEVAAGMDAVALKEKYGKQILIWGNIDKREIAKGGEHIVRELERVAPAVAMGGFIPLIDHGVPMDVPYANYLEYDRLRREMFNLRAIPCENPGCGL